MKEKRENWLLQYQKILEERESEQKWMKQLREKAFHSFLELTTPNFGPNASLSIDKTFPVAEIREDQDRSFSQHDNKIIYCDFYTAWNKYSKIFKPYFQHLIHYDENKYSALHTALINSGTFIYVPPHVKVEVPLTSIVQENNRGVSSFPHSLIIVDEGSELTYVDDISGEDKDFLISEMEIYIRKNARCHYISFSSDQSLYHFSLKRSMIEEDGQLDWIQCDVDGHVKMGYPSCVLKGSRACANMWRCTLVFDGQEKDIGAKMIHLGENTKSLIKTQTILMNGASLTERTKINITKKAKNSKSDVKCDTIIVGECSKDDKIPKNTLSNRSSRIHYESRNSKKCPSWLAEVIKGEKNEENLKMRLLPEIMCRLLPTKQKKLWMQYWDKYKGELK